MNCRICGETKLQDFLSLGTTPLANSFLSKDDLDKEEKSFPLELCFCPNCKLVQLNYVVPAEIMFKNYVYVSSTTNTFKIHFSKMAEELTKMLKLDNHSLAVDIGSNDGILLKGFKQFGVQAIGVEPATNIAIIAEKDGIETINDFFNTNVVNEIIKRKGKADVVTATNVFAHVNDIKSLVGDVKLLLKDNGIFVIEVPYLIDMLEKMTFDTVYHEHLSYFSVTSLSKFFKQMDMEIFNIEKVDVHGGSLRIFVKKSQGKFIISSSVYEILEFENRYGINNFATYKKFADKVQLIKFKLVKYLKKLKNERKMIAGYGAPAKGNTLLNFCNVGTDYIDYIVEDNALKQGLYTPGTHIPVAPSSILEEKKPDYVIILAWNFAEEILGKTKRYRDEGVRFIIPLPELNVI